MEKKRREGLLLLEGSGLFISLFISLFLYSFSAFHNIGILPVRAPAPERTTALLPPCSSLALYLISTQQKVESLRKKACLRVTSEGKSSHKAMLSSSATSTIRLARNILSSQNGSVLFNLSVPNHPSPSRIPSCSAVQPGKGKKRGKKTAITFIINPFSCKSPSPKKIHTRICICNQLYSLFL